MKIRTENSSRAYANPRKKHRPTARERRGEEMLRGCRYAERLDSQTLENRWAC